MALFKAKRDPDFRAKTVARVQAQLKKDGCITMDMHAAETGAEKPKAAKKAKSKGDSPF
tara:strand:+ start:262 stop:438 length:177 start_codon:yes stop_codon:yes gene_type:complete